MKFRSCQCVRIEPLEGGMMALSRMPEGTFYYGTVSYWQDHKEWPTIVVKMPYDAEGEGRHSVHNFLIRGKGEPIPPTGYWEWDGDRDSPTLTPSIACGPEEAREWHGHMTAGRLEVYE